MIRIRTRVPENKPGKEASRRDFATGSRHSVCRMVAIASKSLSHEIVVRVDEQENTVSRTPLTMTGG